MFFRFASYAQAQLQTFGKTRFSSFAILISSLQRHQDTLELATKPPTTPAESLVQVQASVAKRADDGLTDAHYLALFLDPLPSMCAFVCSTVGSSAARQTRHWAAPKRSTKLEPPSNPSAQRCM
jgi:hypothetical protein